MSSVFLLTSPFGRRKNVPTLGFFSSHATSRTWSRSDRLEALLELPGNPNCSFRMLLVFAIYIYIYILIYIYICTCVLFGSPKQKERGTRKLQKRHPWHLCACLPRPTETPPVRTGRPLMGHRALKWIPQLLPKPLFCEIFQQHTEINSRVPRPTRIGPFAFCLGGASTMRSRLTRRPDMVCSFSLLPHVYESQRQVCPSQSISKDPPLKGSGPPGPQKRALVAWGCVKEKLRVFEWSPVSAKVLLEKGT